METEGLAAAADSPSRRVSVEFGEPSPTSGEALGMKHVESRGGPTPAALIALQYSEHGCIDAEEGPAILWTTTAAESTRRVYREEPRPLWNHDATQTVTFEDRPPVGDVWLWKAPRGTSRMPRHRSHSRRVVRAGASSCGSGASSGSRPGRSSDDDPAPLGATLRLAGVAA